ncbi:MAG TPA: hypothetical protein VGX48_15410 [Pyrinomonadaceae bacterium]|nr:hypothetical protein [Pyrinomonadaceae bacterium]
MPREVTGGDGTVWSCAQAYAGLGEGEAAERAEAQGGSVEVVCTPSGGAKTVRLELAAGWEESLGDEELVREIESRRET